MAVDNLCKNEFDHYRRKREPHPLFLEHGIDAVPFEHPDIDRWRNNRQGIRYQDDEHNYDFGGAIDDVWQKPNGDLIIADVKATAVNTFNWEDRFKNEYAKAYQRQLEMYQWLFRKNGFDVTNEAYLVYYNGLKHLSSFDQKLEFELHLIRLECSDEWVEDQVIAASQLLASDEFPEASQTCENCNYLRKRWNITQSI